MRYQGIAFDFNGVLFWDADLQVKSWQVIAKNLRGDEMTDDELATHMHGRPNSYVLSYLAGRTIVGQELLNLIQVKESFYFFIEHLRLDRWFDVAKIVYDDGMRPGKPAPDIYLAAARNIGVAPSECVVVEDAVSGLAAAYAAGIGYIVAIGAPAAFQRLLACNGVAVAIKSLRDFPREQLLDQA
jgi:beta-phosphoglucomutase-like phosphatase (HAD superfamily)